MTVLFDGHNITLPDHVRLALTISFLRVHWNTVHAPALRDRALAHFRAVTGHDPVEWDAFGQLCRELADEAGEVAIIDNPDFFPW